MSNYVSSKIILNKGVIKQLERNMITALEMTGYYVNDEVVTKQVMPFDKGTLQNESTFVDTSKSKQGHVSLVSAEPYARRLYYHPEYNFQTDNNPNAKGEWLEDWTENGKYASDVKRAYAMFLKRLGGV